MRQAMTPDEFAELVGLSRDEVETYRSHGLLDPENDGLLDDVDVIRVQLVREQLDRGGHDPKSLAAAIRDGQIGSMFGMELFEDSKALSLEDAASRVGVGAEQLRELITALGLPWDRLREADADVLGVLTVIRDAGLPWDAILAAARAFGDSLRRLAETEVRLVHVYVHERLEQEGATQEQIQEQLWGVEQNLTPLMDPMLLRLHREYMLQARIEDAFSHLTSSGSQGESLGSVETTIAFVDVASFTALVEFIGDETAVQLLDRIDRIVRPLLLKHDGKLVKQVGDGFMLAFRDPAAAVHFAVATQAELARDPDLPAIRVGINTGLALYRTGDYLGSAVNVASRVVNAAMPSQILLTELVAKAASDTGIPVEEVGVRMLRGVDDPIALYRVRPAVEAPAAAAQ